MNYLALLDALDDDDRAELDRLLKRRRFERGAELISWQDQSRSMFVLLEGYVRVVIYSAEGRVVDFHEAAPGAAFGEIAAIDGKGRSASVVAATEVEVGVLSHADFETMMKRPGFAHATLLRITAQVRALIERIHDFSTLLVRDRLIREILRLAEPEGGGERYVIRRPPTHFDFAARISSHREAVSREMSRLQKRGLLRKTDKKLVLPYRDRLEAELNSEREL
jgi:CRP-like cAMP-binding protein